MRVFLGQEAVGLQGRAWCSGSSMGRGMTCDEEEGVSQPLC